MSNAGYGGSFAAVLGALILTLVSAVIAFGSYLLLWSTPIAFVAVALLLVHELGHAVAMNRYANCRPTHLVFLPFLGAFVAFPAGVKWETLSPQVALCVALAGPLATVPVVVMSVIAWGVTGDPLFHRIAYIAAFLTGFNLIPLGVLDGGRAASAIRQMAPHLVAPFRLACLAGLFFALGLSTPLS